MSKLKNIEEQVQRTLASLDGIQRAAANPFLFTRIIARLHEEKKQWNGVSRILTKPLVVVGTLVIVIVANVLVYMQTDSAAPVSSSDNEQLFAKEYNFSDPADGSFLIINDSNHEQGEK